jgi:hypothetical protein
MPEGCQADWLYTGLNVIESYTKRNSLSDDPELKVASDREYFDCFPHTNNAKC